MHRLSPGDVLVSTVALECLHRQYPGRYLTDVDVSCPALYEHNPWVTKLAEVDRVITLNYPAINQCDHRPVHFMQGFVDDLASQLGIKLVCDVKRPSIYLSEQEKSWVNQVEQETGYRGKFWLLVGSWKTDYQVKKWTQAGWQEVIDRLAGKVQFVQVGEAHHPHHTLRGVIDLTGRTDLRQLVRLAYHAQGALTLESLMHHLMASYAKPCVTLASGFLPVSWARYHTGTIIGHGHLMPCCDQGKGCWRGKLVEDRAGGSVCRLPVLGSDPVAQCQALTTPDHVVEAVLAYYRSGLIT